MKHESDEPRRVYTEVELMQYRKDMAAKMTAAQLMEFIDDDQPRIPSEQVFREWRDVSAKGKERGEKKGDRHLYLLLSSK